MKPRLIIGIGPGKSGSTWLFTFLRSHRHVCSSVIKETGYFLNTDRPSIDYYLERFFDKREGDKFFFEVSNTYIYHPLLMARLMSLDAEIELISILRDPFQRAISHVRHLVRNGEKYSSFEEAIYLRPDILSRGLYAQYLSVFEATPPNIRMHVLDFNELAENEKNFKIKVAQRLSLDPAEFLISEARRFESATPRSRLVARFVKWCSKIARQQGMTGLIQAVKDSRIPSILYAEQQPAGSNNLMPNQNTIEFMKNYFQHSDSYVREKWGIDVSKWESHKNEL